MTHAERLINDLHKAFDYTGDMEDVIEELKVAEAYNFLCAYIARNEAMINSNMEEA